MTGQAVIWAMVAVFGICLGALFSGLEIGVYTLNRISLAVRVGRGDRRARVLDTELLRPDRLLSTLLIGNNLAHYVSGLGIAAVLEIYGAGTLASIVINTAVLLPALFVLAETLPKDLFRTYSDRWTYAFAGYLRAWRLLLTAVLLVPSVAWIGRAVTRLFGGSEQAALVEPRQRINRLIREGVHAGVLSEEQTTFADRALTMRARTVAEEMTPWTRVSSVPLEASSAERASILRRSGASRLPVIDVDGSLVGVLTALDAILDPNATTQKLMAPPVFFAPGESALAALRTMRATRTRLAIVADAAPRQPRGVVAIKDLVEPVTGQLVGS